MFSKILIANRGEIAVRIIRACKEMGIATVAVYSKPDADALHVALADESICIGPSSATESYLNEERIISAALVTDSKAIHPGYGFLSENAHFAALCRKNGIAFIGPFAEDMERLSDKAVIKTLMQEAGLNVIPGSKVVFTLEAALDVAKEIGYPVMLKARAGGGGRGIRMIAAPEDMQNRFPLAIKEAESAFGDGALYIEKYICVCEYQADGLSLGDNKIHLKNPKGTAENFRIMTKKPFKFTLRFKYSIIYNAYCNFAKIPFKNRLEKENYFLVLLTKLMGDIVYFIWNKEFQKTLNN